MKRLNAFAALALLLAGAALARAANTPGGLETPPGFNSPPIDLLQNAPTAQRTERPREPTGNPLWAIPLSSLSATRDRPLFSPSRRPPAPPAVVAAPQAAAPAKAPPAQRPPLTLVGVVVGDNGGIAIFQSEATSEVVRLKIGDSNSGWTLRSVKSREATLQNDRLTVTLTLPTPNLAASSAPPPVPGAPRPPGAPPQSGPNKTLPPGWSVTPTGEIVNTE